MQMRIVVPNERERLRDLTDALDTVLANNGIDRAVIDDVRLVTEEVVANAMDHGFEAGLQHECIVEVRVAGGLLALEFRDDGRPFDPLQAEDPDLDADIADRPIGGLGVHLIRALAERVEYRHDGRHNILGVTLRLPAAAP